MLRKLEQLTEIRINVEDKTEPISFFFTFPSIQEKKIIAILAGIDTKGKMDEMENAMASIRVCLKKHSKIEYDDGEEFELKRDESGWIERQSIEELFTHEELGSKLIIGCSAFILGVEVQDLLDAGKKKGIKGAANMTGIEIVGKRKRSIKKGKKKKKK